MALYFVDGIIFGTSVLARGELARALEILSWNHRNLLQMARILEGATEPLANTEPQFGARHLGG